MFKRKWRKIKGLRKKKRFLKSFTKIKKIIKKASRVVRELINLALEIGTLVAVIKMILDSL